jgi:hypothetical protein
MGVPVDFQKAYDSVGGEVVNTLIESDITMKLVRPIKMYLNKTYSTVGIGKNLSDAFPTQNSMKQGDALSVLFYNIPSVKSKKIRNGRR